MKQKLIYLNETLFSLSVTKPANTNKIKYHTLGQYADKNNLKVFVSECYKVGIKIDSIVFSRIVIEESTIDGESYLEISQNPYCSLPIAGRQLPLLEREARNMETSFEGYIESLNFILNDSRLYNKKS